MTSAEEEEAKIKLEPLEARLAKLYVVAEYLADTLLRNFLIDLLLAVIRWWKWARDTD